MQACRFDCNVSPGDFLVVSQETSKKPGLNGTLEEETKGDGDKEDANVLFSCPNEGCVKIYKRHSGLEKHLSFGKCRMIPEKDNLFDKAKRTYHALLKEDTDTAKALGARNS